VAWVGAGVPEDAEVAAGPAPPEAAVPTQPQGSELVLVLADPVVDVVAVELVVGDALVEALVADAPADGSVGPVAADRSTNAARSAVDAARMLWALRVGVGEVGLLAAAPDPTMAALAATVARAAATGRVACQATDAPAMRL
jgi:hypothetical protein